jgi:non-homologous end joining protein Ku
MAKHLMEALKIKRFDLAEFHGAYQEKLRQLVEAKAKGQELVAGPRSRSRRSLT